MDHRALGAWAKAAAAGSALGAGAAALRWQLDDALGKGVPFVTFYPAVLIAAFFMGPVAGAFCLRGGDTLYGRYWGASRTLPGLHFETCYYQGIDYCLREGLTRFEPGAQGEHKIDRGFLPTVVRSRHWIADAGFADAIARWCDEEAEATRRWAAELTAHSPFRGAPSP